MATLAQYVTELDRLRAVLADELVAMGVPAERTETLQVLIPKVLKIQVGDLTAEVFAGAFTAEEFPTEYGFYNFQEAATMSGMLSVEGLHRMSRAVLTITGTGVDALTVAAEGWEQTAETGKVVLTRTLPEGTTRFELQDMLDAITMTAASEVEATVVFAVLGQDSGETYTAAGSAVLRFQKNSWAMIEGLYKTWGDIEARGLTWEQMESTSKS